MSEELTKEYGFFSALLSSKAFYDVVENTKKNIQKQGGSGDPPDSEKSRGVNGASGALVIQLADTISVMRELFGLFDRNDDGYILMEEVTAMRSHARSLMFDIVLHGMERCIVHVVPLKI